MTPERFTVMAVSGKSETLEFEGTKETRRDAATPVCAMLNQRCAHVLLDATAEGDVVGPARDWSSISSASSTAASQTE